MRNKLDGESPSLNATRREFYDFIEKRVAAINAIPCPRQTAQSRINVSLGGGHNWMQAPQVQGGTRFDTASGTEVGILKSQRTLTGGNGSANLRWGDYIFDFGFSRADGSAQGSVPIGGGNVAQTYIFPNPNGGSTGIAAGNTGQSVKIDSLAGILDVTLGRQFVGSNGDVIEFNSPRSSQGLSTPALDALRFDWTGGAGVRYRHFNMEHTINQQSLTFPGVSSDINLDVNSHFVAPNFFLAANIFPAGPTGPYFGGSVFVAPGVLITDARAKQNSRCNVCPATEQNITLSRDFSKTSFAALLGVDAKAGYQVNRVMKVEVFGGYSYLTSADSFEVPITPTQQPIRLGHDSSSNAFVGGRVIIDTSAFATVP